MHYILQKRRTPALVETTFLESDEMKCFHKARIRFIQYNNRLRYSNCLKIWIYIHIRRAQGNSGVPDANQLAPEAPKITLEPDTPIVP